MTLTVISCTFIKITKLYPVITELFSYFSGDTVHLDGSKGIIEKVG